MKAHMRTLICIIGFWDKPALANFISFFRMFLTFGLVWLLFQAPHQTYFWAFWLTIVIIWMDGLDGYVARKFNECSKAGAVIDILCDRVVEQIYWITFLALGWVPLWMVLAVVARGVVVDGLRSLALEHGQTAFGQSSMMQHPLGVLLVSSRFSRWMYALAKAIAFSFLIAAHMPGCPFLPAVQLIAEAAAWITVIFCLLRGLPVLFEAKRFFL
jgi:CDP-diacylglycerol---glycerol-3-phosphate 3-phosphatidyltransferase